MNNFNNKNMAVNNPKPTKGRSTFHNSVLLLHEKVFPPVPCPPLLSLYSVVRLWQYWGKVEERVWQTMCDGGVVNMKWILRLLIIILSGRGNQNIEV